MSSARLEIVLVDDGKPPAPGKAGEGMPPPPKAGPPAPGKAGDPAPQGRPASPGGPAAAPPGAGFAAPPATPSIRDMMAGIGTQGAVKDVVAPAGSGASGGPAGAVQAGFDQIGGALKRLGEGAVWASEGIKRLAANDNVGALAHAADGAASMLGKIPVVGGALEGSIKGLTAAFTAVNDAAASFVARGKELSKYDANLAGANAMANVENLLADIKEAQTLGPALGRLTSEYTRFQNELRELLLPIKEILISSLTEILAFLRNMIKNSDIAWEMMKKNHEIQMAAFGKLLAFDWEGFQKVMEDGKKELEEIHKQMAERNKKKGPDHNKLMDDFLAGLRYAGAAGAAADPILAGAAADAAAFDFGG